MLSKVENGGIMVDTYVHTEIHVLFEPLFLSTAQNGIHRGIGELEWHISKFSFCNGISPSGENWSGIDPINPSLDQTWDTNSEASYLRCSTISFRSKGEIPQHSSPHKAAIVSRSY
jgi:hypothetical protein